MINVTPPTPVQWLLKFWYEFWYWSIISLITIAFMIFIIGIMMVFLLIEIIDWIADTVKKIFLSLTHGY